MILKANLVPLVIMKAFVKVGGKNILTTRMAIIKKMDKNKCWPGCGEIGIFVYCWSDVKGCSCYGELNIELLYDPAIPVLGIYPGELKTYVPMKTCT